MPSWFAKRPGQPEFRQVLERRAIAVRGVIQGVGFRPFVFGLASRLDLSGFVRNENGGVLIEIEGQPDRLDQFLAELTRQPPPLAEIDDLTWARQDPIGDELFRIEASATSFPLPIFIAPDGATCDDCLAELFDPANRRHGYPFINCTNCGPRLTIITGAPYDRQRTTMAEFAMCAACLAEYEAPRNRRFHAEATCCATCGPRLELRGRDGLPISCDKPISEFAAAIMAGQIGALKGLGGYHMVCDARNEPVVAELRRRKHRDEKPFALMLPNVAAARALCQLSAHEEELLVSKRKPIVLAQKQSSTEVADSVAPKNPLLGIMLPYTPIHHLLSRATRGVPLVMTSGNQSDEPIAYRDDDALRRLSNIADLFLTHNRPIHVRCDDSVTRVVAGREQPLRRSRGYAPRPIALPVACPRPILAVGGQLKGTFALGIGRHAVLSHHLGDLDHYDAYRAFQQDAALYEQLFDVRPDRIAHDLHPDYSSTRFAVERARRIQSESRLIENSPILFPVQHHHAHMASCMAEHGLNEPVIGVTFDGTGYGTDGAIWGGEFLVGGYRSFRRAAHLRYVGLPGGDQAIREPWRVAAAQLRDASCDAPALRARIPRLAWKGVDRMLERDLNTPPSSSVGRLFDAVASLVGVRDRVSYEGQAAIELEWLATRDKADGTYPFDLDGPDNAKPGAATIEVDTRPLIRAISGDVRRNVTPGEIARRFHHSLADIIEMVCKRLVNDTGITIVVLSGGVFMNALLTSEVYDRLSHDGLRVYRHCRVPPNDGGLSLGQLAVAAALTTP